MSIGAADFENPIALEGGKKSRKNLTNGRLRLVIMFLIVAFGAIGVRLVMLGVSQAGDIGAQTARAAAAPARPPIVDRNGRDLAMDILVPSLYASPRQIIDLDEAVEKLSAELPDLEREWLREKLDGNEGFVWIKREMSPAAQERIFNLGIPGINFRTESKRYYPGRNIASHVLGSVNVDNQGIAGMEKYLDSDEFGIVRLAQNADVSAPAMLSIDLRVQYALQAELADALVRYQAIAAAGVIVDVVTGEVLAMVSLPDFDPNDPRSALEEGRFNRITAGTFELGSTFKTVTMAGALDSGAVQITDEFDAREPIRFGRFTINDYRGKRRILSLSEVYKYSSNIGTIRVMQAMGKDNYRAFLTRVGFDDALAIELPETKRSSIPHVFSEVGAATASFGHGLSITPLHMATAVAAFVNDGIMVPPTLLIRTEEQAAALGTRVISSATSDQIRYLMRLNALEGSGRRMNQISDGYMVGGKTGTADKVVDGRYDDSKNFTAFASAFPMDDPQYAMVILVDEPKRENEQSGTTAGWNAGEVTGRVVQKIAPILGIMPNFSELSDTEMVPLVLRDTDLGD
ncbi:MAG: penicillin-binding protein 2 [Devosiaceae bacterium]|nr:penicillin-binding protein 2 [Devosiaceae bacterium]